MTSPPTTAWVWTSLSEDLRRFIRRRVADEHQADDLLQETFVRIHRNLDRLADSEHLVAWVYRICRNVIVDHYRGSAADLPSLEGFDPADRRDEPNARLRADAGGWSHALIEQLPEKYRQAVWLSEIEEKTQQQVADMLGLSLSGAKSRVQRGRAMLKAQLEQCCTFEFDRRGNVIAATPKADRTACGNCEESSPGCP